MSDQGTSPEATQARVLTEIGEELRRRRTAGELLPSLERELDESFADLAPDRAKGSFGAVLDLAERSAYLDIEVPVRSNIPAGGLTKWVLRKLMWWYLDYVVQQLARFTTATTRLMHLLDDRLSRLEGADESGAAASGLVPPFDTAPWVDLIVAAMASVPGRILHTACGDGDVVGSLGARGLAAYGVDTRDELLDRAALKGLDVRRGDPLRHIQGLGDGSLGGLILSGFVDLLALPLHDRLVELAKLKLRPTGMVVLLGTSPEAWTRTAPAVVVDLSPGRPLHAETWSHLLAGRGFERTEIHAGPAQDGPATFAVVGVRGR